MPFKAKAKISLVVAMIIYWPFARISKFLNSVKINTVNIPLHQYADLSFYIMKIDALDRFGTKLEKGSTKTKLLNCYWRAVSTLLQ